jgi:F0F1-type ATP synthase membrane subunit c/vacuolar-type H+-ATPase subunit K
VVAAYAIKALGGAPAMYISLALLSDVLDHQEAVHGFRTDGFTMSIYGAIMIGCNGLANGIINGLLAGTGYDATAVTTGQSEATKTALSWVFYGGETIAFLAIAILFIGMNVEKFSKVDHAEIIAHQKADCEKRGVAYVEPAVRMANEQAKLDQEADEARKVELKATCEKKGLSFDDEEAKYETAQAQKNAAAAKKKAQQEAKKAEKQKAKEAVVAAKEEERKQKLQAYCEKNGLIYQNEEKKYEEKRKADADKKAAEEAAKDAEIQAEFDAIVLKAQQESR